MASYHNKLTKVTLPPDPAYNNPEDEVQMDFSEVAAYSDANIKRKERTIRPVSSELLVDLSDLGCGNKLEQTREIITEISVMHMDEQQRAEQN